MEWSTGLDEDATDSSETLEERSMKNVELFSSTIFILVETCCNYIYYSFLVFLCTLGVSLFDEHKNIRKPNINLPIHCCYGFSYSQNCSLSRCGTSTFSPAVISTVRGLLDGGLKGFQFTWLAGLISVELLRKRFPTVLLLRGEQTSNPTCVLAVDATSATASFKLAQFNWTSDFIRYANPYIHYLDGNLQCEEERYMDRPTPLTRQDYSRLHFSCATSLYIIEKHALYDENKSQENWNILMTSVAENLSKATADVNGDEHTAPRKTIRNDCPHFVSQLNRPKINSYWMKTIINHVLTMTTKIVYETPEST